MGADNESGLAAYEVHQPSTALRPFVRRFLHGYGHRAAPHRIKVPPAAGMFLSYVDGAPLYVHFSDRTETECPRLFIGGQLRREAPVLQSQGHFSLIGAEFAPTGFHRLFHVDAARFTDNLTDFAAIQPAGALDLASRLPQLGDVCARIAALDAHLAELIPDALPESIVDEAVGYLEAARGQLSAEMLASMTTVGPRQLRRQFLRVVGVGPKHAAKITQLTAVVAALTGPHPVRLSACAADCGYFDQSHFIRDFKRYVGSNPVAFLRDEEMFLRQYLGKQDA